MDNIGTEGFVYIMTNPAMPELVKIGMTKRTPSERLEDHDLNTAGIPSKFEVQYYLFFNDVVWAEDEIHEKLKEYQFGKEFFKIDTNTAISSLKEIGTPFEKISSKPKDYILKTIKNSVISFSGGRKQYEDFVFIEDKLKEEEARLIEERRIEEKKEQLIESDRVLRAIAAEGRERRERPRTFSEKISDPEEYQTTKAFGIVTFWWVIAAALLFLIFMFFDMCTSPMPINFWFKSLFL